MEVELNTLRKQRRIAKLERQVAQYQRRRDYQRPHRVCRTPLRSVCGLINCVSGVSVETGEVNLSAAEKQQLRRQRAASGSALRQFSKYRN